MSHRLGLFLPIFSATHILYKFITKPPGIEPTPFSQTTALRILSGLFIVTLISLHARHKKSLTPRGVETAFCVGLIIYLQSLPLFGALLCFFFVSNRATRFRANVKTKYWSGFSSIGNRTAIQVLCNGGTAAHVCFLYLAGLKRGYVNYASLGAICCACADTLASEVAPSIGRGDYCRLITKPWKRVPIGTNGGVTIEGFGLSYLGGAICGLVFALMGGLNDLVNARLHESGEKELWMRVKIRAIFTLMCGLAGCLGSVIDSLLGAVFEKTLWSKEQGVVLEDHKQSNEAKIISGRLDLLSGHSVNFLSSLLTAILAQCLFQLVLEPIA